MLYDNAIAWYRPSTDPQAGGTSSPIAHLRFWREHRFTRGNASSYVEGELAAHERRRVERHAGLCPQCRRFLATLRGMLRALGERSKEALWKPLNPAIRDGCSW
jgi:hypothetical protein